MSGTDSFYTPSPLADKMTSFITAPRVNSAIDFCVGDGDLLKAVARRFDNVELYGVDISDEALKKLGKECPNWHLSQCDFRNDDCLQRIPFLNNRRFDLIVLNPPFTCKGSITEEFVFEGIKFKVSTAMHFLIRALRYLSQNGGLYAILPISCVYSQKDRLAWEFLKAHYNACILDEAERVSFSKNKEKSTEETISCSPNIVMVYAGHYIVKGQEGTGRVDFSSLPITEVVRGSVRMQNLVCSDSPEAIKLIHTTNVQDGRLVLLNSIVPGAVRRIDGYGVVIPRVCNPNPAKIALLDGKETYVLSDCMIVLRTNSQEDALNVLKFIQENWTDFATIYKGTGAQYTTLSRVKGLFGMSS